MTATIGPGVPSFSSPTRAVAAAAAATAKWQVPAAEQAAHEAADTSSGQAVAGGHARRAADNSPLPLQSSTALAGASAESTREGEALAAENRVLVTQVQRLKQTLEEVAAIDS